jgi:hypothetical protein
LSLPERSPVRDFLDAYRAAFEAFDVPAIADLFAYPCQVTGDAGELAVTAATREAWILEIERLVAAYRAIGVRVALMMAATDPIGGSQVILSHVCWQSAMGLPSVSATVAMRSPHGMSSGSRKIGAPASASRLSMPSRSAMYTYISNRGPSPIERP